MAIIKDKKTKKLYDSDELVASFIERQPKEEQEALINEYHFGSDMSAWVEKFIKDKSIKTPDGNDVEDVKEMTDEDRVKTEKIKGVKLEMKK